MSDRIAPEDPVEAEMGSGTVLRRDKVVARSLALICLLMFVAFGAASIAYMRGWQPDRSAFFKWITYLLVPFSAWIGLTKTVLRTVVTEREIHVQQGFGGVHIQIASITKCRVFGAERPEGGTELYFPAGSQGILVHWRDELGKDRKALIGSQDAPALLASIERARAASAGKVRVATAEPTTHEQPLESEADATPESKRKDDARD